VTTRVADGTFSNKKSKFCSILEGLKMDNVGVLYGQLVYLTNIWYILWPLGNFVYFILSLVFCVEKNLATLVTSSLAFLPSSELFGKRFFVLS
jgi:hypothetical protein